MKSLETSPDNNPMTIKDRYKLAKRTLRYYIIRLLVNYIQKFPVKSFKTLERKSLKIFRLAFGGLLKKAEKQLPKEFESQKHQIIRNMFKNFVLTILEVILYEKLIKNDPQYVKIEGREYLDAAAKKNKGILILSAHFGNWELIGYTLAKLGFGLHVVARPQTVNQMTEFINSFRENRGINVIMGNNILSSVKLLKKGKTVGLVSDLNAKGAGYRVKFFNRTASFYNAPVIIALRSGSPVIPTFCERQSDGRHIIRFEEPIVFSKELTTKQNIQKYVNRYEAAFRKRPDHWCWFHDRYELVELGRA